MTLPPVQPRRADVETAGRVSRSGPRSVFRALADYGILAFLLALILYFDRATGGLFHEPGNLTNIGLQVAINTILAVGMTLVIITGGIDLSVGSVLAFSGVVVTNTLMNGFVFAGHTYMAPLPVGPGVAVGFALALGLGALLGATNGLSITRLGVPPFIATLAMYTAARGLAKLYTNARPVGDLPDAFKWWGMAPMVVIAVCVVLAGEVILRRTRFGRYVYAVGGNEEAARLSGVPVAATKMAVYVLIGTLAGLCGLLQAARLGSGDPMAGVGYELNAIAAVVLGGTSLMGGRGTVTGTLIGAIVIGVLNNGLQLVGVSPYSQEVAMGVVILLAVVLDQMKNRWLQRA